MLDIPSGSSLNLGYIQKDGAIWTSVANTGKVVPAEFGHVYNEELASALGVALNKDRWSIWGHRRSLVISEVTDRLDAWLPVIDRFRERAVAWTESENISNPR